MVRAFLAQVYRRDRVLALTGWAHLALLVVMLCVAPFDARTVTGLNPWFKPIKFAVSIAVYVWTVAWFMAYVPGASGVRRTIRWGISIAMTLEMICIGLQAARGMTSHYNVATPFDAALFSTMGIMIGVNTVLAFLLLVLFFLQTIPLSPAYLWGLRIGMLVFVLGSLEGLVMIFQQAHTVGAADGGPGLPFVN